MPPIRRARYTIHRCRLAPSATVDHSLDSRLSAVRLIESLLDQHAGIPCVVPDTLGIEHFLALRPERFETVEQAIADGNLLIGPWYATPRFDHPETLIRNLLMGLSTANALGGSQRIPILDHLPPGWMPQILRGMGIEAALLRHGEAESAPLERWWIGDDSSRIALGNTLIAESAGSLSVIRQWAAPHSGSGHMLIASTGVDSAIGLTGFPDDIGPSSPANYARALTGYLQNADPDDVRLVYSPPSTIATDPLCSPLMEYIEPLTAFVNLDLPDNNPLYDKPHMLMRRLWSLALGHADHARTEIEAVAARIRSGLRDVIPQPILESPRNLIGVNHAVFAITALKLPEDREKDGLVVRGWNTGSAPLPIRLMPWRRFSRALITRLDETPTGGQLGVDETGAIQFQAAPGQMITLWLMP